MDWEKVKSHILKYNAQSHLAICNDAIFQSLRTNGIYGFPHSGISRKKSFWRALASLYNIGSKDLIFIYRTNGTNDGCKQIHGPFQIYEDSNNIPCLYYDLDSVDFPIKVGKNEADCKARFLFKNMANEFFSINDNYELIKKFETKEIWGYRHPAVMNIGAARKKSVTSLTTKQTKSLIGLFEKFGIKRGTFTKDKTPNSDRLQNYNNFKIDKTHFYLNDKFLINNYSNDEAFYYSYLIRAFKIKECIFRKSVIANFWEINKEILIPLGVNNLEEVITNVMLETIITVHLQDELDVVSTNLDDSILIFYEFKKDEITKDAVYQAEKYIDLLEVIFPDKKIIANVIGSNKTPQVSINEKYRKKMKLVKFTINEISPLKLSFQKA